MEGLWGTIFGIFRFIVIVALTVWIYSWLAPKLGIDKIFRNIVLDVIPQIKDFVFGRVNA